MIHQNLVIFPLPYSFQRKISPRDLCIIHPKSPFPTHFLNASDNQGIFHVLPAHLSSPCFCFCLCFWSTNKLPNACSLLKITRPTCSYYLGLTLHILLFLFFTPISSSLSPYPLSFLPSFLFITHLSTVKLKLYYLSWKLRFFESQS